MGGVSHEGRLPHPIPQNPSQIPEPHPINIISGRIGTFPSTRPVDIRDADKVSHRNRIGQLHGILLSHVRSAESIRRMETHNRLKPAQRLHSQTSLQDGDTRLHQTSLEERRLVDVHRPQGRLFPYSDPPILEALPKIRMGQHHLPVQSHVLRPEHSALCIHTSVPADLHTSTPGRSPIIQVPGRLATGSEIPRRSDNGHQLRTPEVPRTGTNCQFQKIRSHTNEIHSVSGNAPGHDLVPSQALTGPFASVRKYTQLILARHVPHSGNVPQSSGPHVLTREAYTPGKAEDTTHPIPPVSELEHIRGHAKPYTNHIGRPDGGPVVAEPEESDSRRQDSPRTAGSPDIHRCIQNRLGGTRCRSQSPRTLVSRGTSMAHKCSGAGSALARSPGISELSEKLQCGSHDGQRDGSGTDKESRRHQVAPSNQNDRTDSTVDTERKNKPVSKTHPGLTQCHSRPAEQKGTTPTRRVVTKPGNLHKTLENMGKTGNRSFRNKGQQEASALLQPDPGRTLDRNRRSITTLGRQGPLCVSADTNSTISTGQTGGIKECANDTDSPMLGQPDLVPPTPGTSDGRPHRSRTIKKVIETTRKVPRKTGHPEPSRVESIIRSYRKAGFSKEAATRMSQSTRRSTNKVYQSKWSLFSNWCHQRKENPRKATIPLVADFCIFLRTEKSFTIPTIKGYRSALALVLKAKNVDITNSPELTALIRSMANEVPPKQQKLPKWDLSLVLQTLIEQPYEPLEEASLKFLTHKTVFLIALASAKRVSEIQALAGKYSHKQDWSWVAFDYAKDFLAKNEIPDSTRKRVRTFLIPSLGKGASDNNDLLLCPVRALRIYCRRTADRRIPESHLFIPVLGQRSSVSKNTISAWITSVVRRAYTHQHQELHTMHKITAHEVRALATSWQFHHTLSLESVMDAAAWRCHSTFSEFYLRDVTFVADGLHKLGPIVAAQRVL